MTTALAALAALAAIAVLVRIHRRHARRARDERGRLYDRVRDVVEHARIDHAGHGYPLLTGVHRGHRVRLEPLVDTLALRTLPSLWLVVTLERRLDVTAPLDVLSRPTGTEFFSPNATFRHQLERPAGYPGHLRIASPDPAHAPTAALDLIAPLVSDPGTKEVLISSGGVRVVRRIAQADQGPYRSTRRADFGSVRIAPDGLRELLDALDAVGDALASDEGALR